MTREWEGYETYKFTTDIEIENIKFKEQEKVNIFMAWWLDGWSVKVSVLKIEKGIYFSDLVAWQLFSHGYTVYWLNGSVALQSGLPTCRAAPTNIPWKLALYSVVKPTSPETNRRNFSFSHFCHFLILSEKLFFSLTTFRNSIFIVNLFRKFRQREVRTLNELKWNLKKILLN